MLAPHHFRVGLGPGAYGCSEGIGRTSWSTHSKDHGLQPNVERGWDSSPTALTPHMPTSLLYLTLSSTAIEKGKGKAKKGSSFQTVSALHRVSVWLAPPQPCLSPAWLSPDSSHPVSSVPS